LQRPSQSQKRKKPWWPVDGVDHPRRLLVYSLWYLGRSRKIFGLSDKDRQLAAPNENIDEEDDEEDAGSKMPLASKRKVIQ